MHPLFHPPIAFARQPPVSLAGWEANFNRLFHPLNALWLCDGVALVLRGYVAGFGMASSSEWNFNFLAEGSAAMLKFCARLNAAKG